MGGVAISCGHVHIKTIPCVNSYRLCQSCDRRAAADRRSPPWPADRRARRARDRSDALSAAGRDHRALAAKAGASALSVASAHRQPCTASIPIASANHHGHFHKTRLKAQHLVVWSPRIADLVVRGCVNVLAKAGLDHAGLDHAGWNRRPAPSAGPGRAGSQGLEKKGRQP